MQHKKVCKDHKEKTFESVSAMCKHYGINTGTFQYRIRHGWNLEDALTKELQNKVYYDNEGVAYDSLDAMCKAHGVSKHTFKDRIKHGWTLGDALSCKDSRQNYKYLLNGFKSVDEMCLYYNINIDTFKSRVKHGWTLEAALTSKCRTPVVVYDGLGNGPCNLAELATKYNIKYNTLRSRVKSRVEICVALVCKDNVELKFIGLDGKARYSLNRSENLQTARQIIEHYRPDLLSAYDKHNPTGKYEPYEPNKEDSIHE